MSYADLPQLLSYNGIKPRGIQTQYKQMRFTPLSSYNVSATNDIIRFWIPYSQGFIDPYKTYIRFQVQVDPADFPYGNGCQVDNSASTFINQLTITVDSKQVQKILQYDTIAAMLHDVQYKPSDKFGQQYQGFGYASHTSLGTSVDTRRMISSQQGFGARNHRTQLFGNTNIYHGQQGFDFLSHHITGYRPQQPIYITPSPVVYPVGNGFHMQDITAAALAGSNVFYAPYSATVGGLRYMQVPMDPSSGATVPLTVFNGGKQDTSGLTTRYQIATKSHPYTYQLLFLYASVSNTPLNNNFTGTGQPFSQQKVNSCRPWIQSHMQNTQYGIQGTNSYNFQIYPNAAFTQITSTQPFNASNHTQCSDLQTRYSSSTVYQNGYSQAFSEQLSNASYQPLFAPGLGDTWIHRGKFLTKPLSSVKKVFYIPLISSLLGVMIPAESYKLLPMAAFKNLMLQFRLNQYAMFTSGYATTWDNNAINPDKQAYDATQQLKRQWYIQQFQLWADIYQFDQTVTNAMLSQLSSGITLSSCAWNIGPRFSLSTTSQIKNTWQINCGYQSLQTIALRIQSDDYQQFSFCRKHFYQSGNITSLQLKVANQYIPPQPIQGHAGNVIATSTQDSNAAFLIQMHKTFGSFFNIGANTYINSTNFAINQRPYDITNLLPYRNSTSGVVQNIDTACGLPLFHQNRCVGRALYTFNLQAIPGQPYILSGLDTTKYRPFQVIIDAEPDTSPVTKDSTLIFLLNYDVIYLLSAEPPQVFGKGSSSAY